MDSNLQTAPLRYSVPSSFWDQNDTIMAPGNASNFNMSMRLDKDIDLVCSNPSLGNSTACNKSALAISLWTPILMLSTGVLGNLLALLVLYTSKKEMKRTIFFPLLLGLAWTDLIGQLCTGPIAIVTYANNLQWVGGDQLCTYHGFMMVWFGLLTPLIACCMSLERFVALKFSYFYARVATRRMAQHTIVACWVITCFICMFPLVGFGSYEHQFPGSWCFLNFHRESDTDTAYASIFAVLNILFICVMVVCNVTVVITLIRMRRSRKIINSPSIDRKFSVKPKSLLQMEIEAQLAWFLCAITFVFSTCWLPLNVHIIINQITGKKDYARDLISVRLASINQILDPWLYILLRKAMFIKILNRVKQYIFSKKDNSSANTHKYSQNPDQKSFSHAQKSLMEKPANQQVLSMATLANNTVKLVPVMGTKSSNRLPTGTDQKYLVEDNSESESEVFLGVNNAEKSNHCNKNCRRSYNSYDSYGCRTDNVSPNIKRLNSLPAYLTEDKKGQNGDMAKQDLSHQDKI